MNLKQLSLHWVIIGSLFLISMTGYYVFNYFYVYTSDAYVEAYNVSVNPEVSGPVSEVFVKEGQLVKKGDPLFQINPAPYLYLRDYALGSLQVAIQAKASLKESIQASKAEVDLAKFTKNYNARVWQQKKRIINLAITKLEGEGARYDAQSAGAALASSIHTLKSSEATLGANDAIEFPSITVAKANLKTALYNLMHTKVLAPFSGYISNMYLTPGTYLNAGTSTFGLISNDQRWVLARFKESFIRHIHVGDHATLRFRMFPGSVLHGTVSSIGPGVNRQQSSSSVSTSALPYLEQTEDWVELDQRFPVRIMIDKKDLKQHRLIPVGSSASVVIARSH